MGKNKISSARSRLFSPWKLADTNSKSHHNHNFEIYAKNGDFESSIMDEDMQRAILQIEKEQLDRIEQNREEENMTNSSFLSEAPNLGLHSSNQNCLLLLSENILPQLSMEDQAMYNVFFDPEQVQPLLTLQEEVAEKEKPTAGSEPSLCSSDPQVRQVYTRIGEYLSRYQSGKLPKAFKIIPSLPNWDNILLLTKPHLWTPHAIYEATKIFTTTVKATQTKQFFQLVLLHSLRNNLIKNNQTRLDMPLYLALQKALKKAPALFLKGLLIPLCESKSCTVLEASVIARVIVQSQFPVLQSATALLKLSELSFTLPIGILVLVFLEKKQALPYRVIDTLIVKYFANQQTVGRDMVLPQVWFQALYTFIKSYGLELVPTQKRKLLDLIQSIQQHDMSKYIEKAIKINDMDEFDTEEDSDESSLNEDDCDIMMDE
ncbi:Bystin-domain-containing protein [Pilaira anomala]|nr:Bystin-domain-containing protein [Pilaira anomala]